MIKSRELKLNKNETDIMIEVFLLLSKLYKDEKDYYRALDYLNPALELKKNSSGSFY